VAATSAIDRIANREHFHQLPTGQDRQCAHTAISTISSEIAGGIGSSCARKLSRYPAIASRMFARASSRDDPWEAARQDRHVRYEHTVFVLFYQHPVLHGEGSIRRYETYFALED
jgi:hypothetical protein